MGSFHFTNGSRNAPRKTMETALVSKSMTMCLLRAIIQLRLTSGRPGEADGKNMKECGNCGGVPRGPGLTTLVADAMTV